MIPCLNLVDIKAESWSKQLTVDALVQTIHEITELYNDKKSAAGCVSDYLQLKNILLGLYQHYRKLLIQIHNVYYGFLSPLFRLDQLQGNYASLTKFYIRIKSEAIWLAHKFALFLNTRNEGYYFFEQHALNLSSESKEGCLSSRETINLHQADDELKRIFKLKLNFLAHHQPL